MSSKTISHTRAYKSKIDQSVNWVSKFGAGSIESRFVRKKKDYVIGYVSSHSGCKMGCKQCFLTQQGQTAFDHVTPRVFGDQIQLVLDHYAGTVADGAPAADRLNVNFMARGEPLANRYVVNEFGKIFKEFEDRSRAHRSASALTLKVNISTIFPHAAVGRRLSDMFAGLPVHMYYSLYSVDDAFRKAWMPNAAPVEVALDELKRYEDFAHRAGLQYPVTFHWAVIKGHNDGIASVRDTAAAIKKYGFRGKFNLVRYNAHPGTGTEEPSQEALDEIFDIVAEAVGSDRSYIVPRVGKDVSASCGMFIEE